MKTEQDITARRQTNVEQEAVFLPKNNTTDSGYIEIDERDPVIFPSTDEAQSSIESSEDEKSSEFKEAKKIIGGFVLNTAVTNQFAKLTETKEGEKPEEKEERIDSSVRRLSTELQHTTELLTEHLPLNEQRELAELAYEELSSTEPDEIAKALVEENKAAVKVVKGLSLEVKAKKDDIESIERGIRDRKIKLVERVLLEIEGSEKYNEIKDEIEFLNSLLRRNRTEVPEADTSIPAMPTTDELEKMYHSPSHESNVAVAEEVEPESPTRFAKVRLLAKKAVSVTTHLLHK